MEASVPSKLCACARAHGFQRLRTRINLLRTNIIMMKQCSRLATWGKLYLDLLKQGFLTRGAGLMNEKLDICGRDELFFYYSWVVAQTLVISKKVRTRQSFCAHKLQKIRGNIGGGLKVLRAPGKKQYAGPFQQCWKKDQSLSHGSIV